MQKPIDLAIEDFRQSVIVAINESQLPGSVMVLVLGALTNQINSQVSAQLPELQKQYTEAVAHEQSAQLPE